MTRPPAIAERLLARALQPDEREELLGDLHEQFDRRVAIDGVRAARRWYWRQAIALAWGFARDRRDVVSTSHERRRGRWFASNLALDWRDAWRSLRASRSFAMVAVLTLTLGIGLSTAVFSLVDGVLLEPLPYPESDRLLRLAEFPPPTRAQARILEMADGTSTDTTVSDTAIGALIATSHALESLTPMMTGGKNVTTPHGIQQVDGGEVGGAFFNLLGARPIIGRLLLPTDSDRSAPPVAVLSDRFWRTAFDARPDIVNTSVSIDGKDYTVVGVSPALTFPDRGLDVWTAGQWLWPSIGARRNFGMHADVIARLRPGATVTQAQTDGVDVMKRIAMADPSFDEGTVPVATFRARRLQDDVVARVRPALVTLMIGMAIVLVAASVNLASLLVARGTARRREIAVRLALGAARWRLIRPLLFEQILLAGLGAIGGAVLAWWVLRGVPLIAPANLPRLSEIHFSVASLAFAVAGSLAIGLVASLLPAWHLPGANLRDLTPSARTGGAGGTRAADRTRRVLVVAEVALASVLLVGAVLIGRTLVALLSVNPGYDPRNVLTFQVALPEGWWRDTGREARFFDSLAARLEQNPEVVAAGVSSTLPLLQIGHRGSFSIEGRPKPQTPDAWPLAIQKSVTSGYFKAVGTRIVRGRGFTDQDTKTSEKVTVIDEALARAYLANEDPIGQHVSWTVGRVFTVVGIAEASHQGQMSSPVQPTLYMVGSQLPDILAFNVSTGGMAVRTKSDPMNLAPLVQTAVRELDPGAPVHDVMRLDDRLDRTFAEPRFYAIALGLFAALALSTAVLGVYGVLSYAVERRRVEFGVRRALGAGERQIGWLVVGQALLLSGVGLAIGLGAAASGAGIMRSLLFGVRPLDPVTFLAAAGLVVSVAIAAAWHPSRRALRVDPAEALRME